MARSVITTRPAPPYDALPTKSHNDYGPLWVLIAGALCVLGTGALVIALVAWQGSLH